jgi:ribosomal-protein-alanine N-acetyltransferase
MTRSPERIETRCLVGTRLSQGHWGELCAMHSNPRVMATLGGLRTDEQTTAFIADADDHWRRHGFGLWAWHDRRDGRFAGRAGLRHTDASGLDQVEVAYALVPEFWGRGLAFEVARASVDCAFQQLGLLELIGFTLVTNGPSRRVMEKIGFGFERPITYDGLPHVLYRLERQPEI